MQPVFASQQPKTLVIMDPDDLKLPITHSLFFRDLTLRGHKLIFARSDDSSLALTVYGEHLYDNLILLSSKTDDFGGTVDVAEILEFVDSGRNLLIVATPDASETIREVAVECGVAMIDDERSFIQDHFAYDVLMDDGNHSVVASDAFAAPDIVIGEVPPAHLSAVPRTRSNRPPAARTQ